MVGECFGDMMSRGVWPPSLEHLNPCDFYLWSMYKTEVHSNSSCSEDSLDCIQVVVVVVLPEQSFDVQWTVSLLNVTHIHEPKQTISKSWYWLCCTKMGGPWLAANCNSFEHCLLSHKTGNEVTNSIAQINWGPQVQIYRRKCVWKCM